MRRVGLGQVTRTESSTVSRLQASNQTVPHLVHSSPLVPPWSGLAHCCRESWPTCERKALRSERFARHHMLTLLPVGM
jgi:hypothetical protein